MVRCNIVRLEPEGGLIMLMFLATLSASVVACFGVEAMDIERVGAAKSRMSRYLTRTGKVSASYPNGAAAGACQ